MDLMERHTLLNYKNYRDLKTTSLLVATAVVAYIATDMIAGEAYGGTWLGYVLGILSVMIIFLLIGFGVTKRRTPKDQDRRQYHKSERRECSSGITQIDNAKRRKEERRKHRAKEDWYYGRTLQGWLSAHIYLGASLIVLASLHTGFQFGWNVHTMSYALMLLVIVSGFYGVYAYLNYPKQLTKNMSDDNLDNLLPKIVELDELARIRALSLPDEVNVLVMKARHETRVGGNLFQQLSGYQRNCPTAYAVEQIQQFGTKYTQDDQPKLMHDLYSLLLRKEKLVLRARTEIMLKARLGFWLYLHVPLSIALLAALTAHIVAIFLYR